MESIDLGCSLLQWIIFRCVREGYMRRVNKMRNEQCQGSVWCEEQEYSKMDLVLWKG